MEVNNSELQQNTFQCPNCGTVFEEGENFCSKCGMPKRIAENKVCERCGTKLRAEQEFCPICGQKYVLKSAIHENSPLIKRRQIHITNFDAILYSVLCLAGIILLFIDGFFSYAYIGDEFYCISREFNAIFLNCDWGVVFLPFIIIDLSAIIVIEWISFFIGKRLKTVPLICGILSVITWALGTVIGATTFDHYYSGIMRLFNSLEPVFYIELVLLVSIVVLQALSFYGIVFFRKKGEYL